MIRDASFELVVEDKSGGLPFFWQEKKTFSAALNAKGNHL